MDLTKSILKDIRAAVGFDPEVGDYDVDLLMHINSAIGRLNQNGVGNFLVVDGVEQTWGDLQNPEQAEGNQYFKMVYQFIVISTKLIFDPPPPSIVQYYVSNTEQTLWRLKVAYEEPYILPTTEGSE